MSSPSAVVTDVLVRLVTGPARTPPGIEAGPVGRHRAEYREPSVWVWRRIVGTAFAFVLVALAWYLVKVPDGLVSDETLPTQAQVASAFEELRTDGLAGAPLTSHLAASLARLVLALLIGVGVGGLLGLASGSSPILRTVVDPVGSLARMVPAVALGPLVVIWFGVGEVAIVAAAAAAVTMASFDAVDSIRIRSLRSTGDDLVHQVVGALRRAVATGWAAVLAIETVMAPIGLGPMIWSAQQRSDQIVAGLCVIGAVGLVVDTTIRAIEYAVVIAGPRGTGRAAGRGRSGSLRDRPAARA